MSQDPSFNIHLGHHNLRLKPIDMGEGDVKFEGRSYKIITDSSLIPWVSATLKRLSHEHPQEGASKILDRLSAQWEKPQKSMQDTSSLEQLYAEEVSLKQQLKTLRSDCKADLARGVPAEQVAKRVGERLRGMIAFLYDEGIKKFGPPPCRFSFVVLGSLAREECGPFPDIDCVMLIERKTPESEAYFSKLNQYVAHRAWRLGESEKLGHPGFRFCDGGMTHPYLPYASRMASNPEEAFVTVATREVEERGDASKDHPLFTYRRIKEQLASGVGDRAKLEEELQALFYRGAKRNLIEPSVPLPMPKEGKELEDREDFENTIADSLHVTGDLALYQEWQKHKIGSDAKTIEMFITNNIKIFEAQGEQWPFVSGKIPKILRYKDLFYRFPQCMVAALARHEGITSSNTIERIDALQKQGVINPEFAERLKRAMDQLIKLRFILQLHFGKELEIVSTVGLEELGRFQEELKQKIASLEGQELTEDQRGNKRWMEVQVELYPTLLKKEFPKGVHTPAIPPNEWEKLVHETLPTLRELFQRLQACISGPAFTLEPLSLQ